MDIVNTLLEMLTYKRPADSKVESQFINKFIDVVPGMNTDTFGNRWIDVPSNSGTRSKVMYSSHTDTVHRTQGKQKVFVDNHIGQAFLSGKTKSNCLGADDCAGIAVMLYMIEHGTPGLYVFHRQEEIGGIGSTHFLNEQEKGLLVGIDYCVAFDRKGYNSVITHQAGGRCCSDGFANAMCEALGQTWQRDDTGVFTDSATYMYDIPECTNISVGYENEHTKSETVNFLFVETLAQQMVGIDVASMPVERDPAMVEDYFDTGWKGDYLTDHEAYLKARDVVYNDPELAVESLTEYFKWG